MSGELTMKQLMKAMKSLEKENEKNGLNLDGSVTIDGKNYFVLSCPPFNWSEFMLDKSKVKV